MVRTTYRMHLSVSAVRKLELKAKKYLRWDDAVMGLAVEVQPKGHKAWKFIYSIRGRTRWLTIGGANAMKPGEARKLANEYRVIVDKDLTRCKKIAEEIGKLRAGVNLKRASDDREIVVLPSPLSRESRLTLR
jgi:hypothetical protein